MSVSPATMDMPLADIMKGVPAAAGFKGMSSAAQTKKTRIICTLGPACWSVEMLGVLLDEGMNVARLNFSHGDHPTHARTIGRLKEALALRPGVHCAIMLDTKGPEIRTGFFAPPYADGKIELKAGAPLTLTTDYDYKSDGTKLACTYGKLPQSVAPGNQILIADGSLVLEVKQVLSATEVACVVMNDCAIGERKNMNLPGVVVELPVLQDKDTKDLVEFACPQGVDFVAVSFVQSAADVQTVRAVLDGAGGKAIKIISKIENQEGLANFEGIVAATDAVMVARGDLGMEIPPERVFVEQKMMIDSCGAAGKPVIVATQMLESMCGNPRPRGAEKQVDVAAAYLRAHAHLKRGASGATVVESTVAAATQAARDAGAKAVVSQALIPGCQALHTPALTNYGYDASGDDEAAMVLEGAKCAFALGHLDHVDDIVCAVHSDKVGVTKNIAMRFFYAGAALSAPRL
ncbi:pyruvate kinase [Aureococcus anophagefferens]|nr:pyruvate kinase [Aureococcus anophagefferens]